MSASRLSPLLRRGSAVLALVAICVGAWFLFLRDEDAGTDPEPRRAKGVPADIDQLARSMSTAEQVDQVLLLGFEGTDSSAPFVAELAERQIGGVLVGPDNGVSPELMDSLRRAGRSDDRIPPLLVAAQEGGIYRAFEELPPQERALDIGDQGSVETAEAWAQETAKALRDAGFHLNLFPVADVATLNSPLGGRAFSDDPTLTASLTAATLRGCAAAELGCAPLHFPGLGAASQDTAQGPATVSLDESSLADRDLLPFFAAITERAPALVLSLAFYSAYDPVTPAALTPRIAERLLRIELGYEGAAITSDLGSGAVQATASVPAAAVDALRAGSDLLQIAFPEDQDGVREALLAAAESGELPRNRLAEAASRVLELKRRLGVIEE